MARVHTKRANKAYTCSKCRKAIEKGSRYHNYTLRPGGPGSRGQLYRRCLACGRPRASEMTSSEFLGAVYAAQEAFEDAIADASTIDDILSAISDARDAIEDAKQTCEEKLSNLENAFPNGCPGIELQQERIDACDNCVSQFDDAENEVEQHRSDFEAAETRESEGDEESDEESESTDDILANARSAAESIDWPG